MRLFHFLLMPHISSDNVLVHTDCIYKVSTWPKVVTPWLFSYMWKTIVEPDSATAFLMPYQSWYRDFRGGRLLQDVHDLAEYLALEPHNLLFHRECRLSCKVPYPTYLSGSWSGTLASRPCGICNANLHVMNSCKAPCRFVSFYLWWVSRNIPAWAFFRL